MTAIERTAYPRLKRILSAKDLEEVYTPTPQERFLALRSTKGEASQGGRDVEVFDDVGHADQILLQRPRHEDGVRTVWEGQERR